MRYYWLKQSVDKVCSNWNFTSNKHTTEYKVQTEHPFQCVYPYTIEGRDDTIAYYAWDMSGKVPYPTVFKEGGELYKATYTLED